MYVDPQMTTITCRTCSSNMAKGAKGRRNSQKKKKSSKGTDEGETENGDEGEYNNNVFFVPLGRLFSWCIKLLVKYRDDIASGILYQYAFYMYVAEIEQPGQICSIFTHAVSENDGSFLRDWMKIRSK